MKRKEILRNMHDKIPRLTPEKIDEIKQLFNLPASQHPSNKSNDQIVDEFCDSNTNFPNIREIIRYERSLQNEFDDVCGSIKQNISSNGNVNMLKGLFTTFDDIMKAIRISYITLDSGLANYERNFSDLKEEVKEHMEMKGAYKSSVYIYNL